MSLNNVFVDILTHLFKGCRYISSKRCIVQHSGPKRSVASQRIMKGTNGTVAHVTQVHDNTHICRINTTTFDRRISSKEQNYTVPNAKGCNFFSYKSKKFKFINRKLIEKLYIYIKLIDNRRDFVIFHINKSERKGGGETFLTFVSD